MEHHFFLFFFIFGILITCHVTTADFVTFFDHSNGGGIFFAMDVTSCQTFPRGWEDRVSSLLLMSKSCVELHESRLCTDNSPAKIVNGNRHGQIMNLGSEYEFNDRARAIKPCAFVLRNAVAIAHTRHTTDGFTEIQVSLYEFVDKKGNQADVSVFGCADVPEGLKNNIASVDSHGNCVRLYAGLQCTGDSVQIQPNDPGSTNLHFSNFLDRTSSVSVCEDFQLLALSLHNSIRRRHNSPTLQLNEDLNIEAQTTAQILANQNDTPIQRTFNSGLLMYTVEHAVQKTGYSALIQQAMSDWYAARMTFDPMNPLPSPFTQLTWRAATQMGIGVGTSAVTGRSVVVVKYS